MAYKEVPMTDDEVKKSGGGGDFVRFTAIGDKFEGVFKGYRTGTGKYGPTNLYDAVDLKTGKDWTIDANHDLHARLQKAIKAGTLKAGGRFACKFAREVPIPGKSSALRSFQLFIDEPEQVKAEDVPF